MKHFLVILGLTALVWLGVSMSDEHDYPMRVEVQMTGFDTVRYAVLQADTSLNVTVQMAGFNAMLHSLFRSSPKIKVDVGDDGRAVAVADLHDELLRAVTGASEVSSRRDSLRIVLVERASRVFQPRINKVDFSFTEQYGLYGEPVMSPAEVTLYGPAQVLDSIEGIYLADTSISNIDHSARYTLPLEPVWEQYADVYPSVKQVEMYLPVEAFVEHEYTVPVTVEGCDSTVTLLLYPEVATVRVWVPQQQVGYEPDLKVSIDYNDMIANGGVVTPQLVEFPAYVRPRSVEPREIQCVVIK